MRYTDYIEFAKLTTAERDALTGVPVGGVIENTTTGITQKWNGSSWDNLKETKNHSELTFDDGTNPHGTTKTDVGLGNVDNTSDTNKPISTATQNALDLKYDANNPNGYETPSQLNTRDTNNRDRANHTGTQLASTISDIQTTITNNTNVLANTAKVSFPEAPNDGQEYVRKNLTWQIATGGGGGVSRNNFVLVKSKSDFPAPSGGVITLANNTTYELNGQIVLGADHIVMGTSCLIRGVDKSDDGLVYTGTGAAIRSTNQDLSLKSFYIVANDVAGSALDLTANGTQKLEIAELIFNDCTSLGTIGSGFNKVIFRQNLVINSGGLTINGGCDDVAIIDNLIENMLSTTTAITMTAGTNHTVIIERNMIETSVGQTALNISVSLTLTAGGLISNNSLEGDGTKLTGINANSSGWRIQSRGNIGIAGLYRTNRTIVLGTLSSTTSGSWLSVTQQVLTRNSITDYEPDATILKGFLSVGMSHDANGGSVGFRLFNFTDNTVVAGSTVSPVIITKGSAYQIFQSNEFDLLPGKEYRVEIIKNSGQGNQSVYINGGDLSIRAY